MINGPCCLSDQWPVLFQLINQQCAGDESLVELIMNSLLGRLVDTSHIVRMLCIRGLGNISSVSKEQVPCAGWLCACVCECICMSVSVCVCVYERERERFCSCLCMVLCLYPCVCVFV